MHEIEHKVIDEAMEQALAETLEQLAFICLLPAGEELPATPEDGVRVSIEFGKCSDRLEIYVPRSFGAMLAGNAMGAPLEGPDAQERGDDALKELANMVCGYGLRKVAGEGDVPEMGIPSMSVVSPQEWDQAIAAGAKVQDGDGFAMWARVVRRSAAREAA